MSLAPWIQQLLNEPEKSGTQPESRMSNKQQSKIEKTESGDYEVVCENGARIWAKDREDAKRKQRQHEHRINRTKIRIL